ncbi:MAG: DUF3999 domain-containing protein [Desulfamplus sp.]|nr:DUF3999 domain-containing protein [Desulfamplus sp.]
MMMKLSINRLSTIYIPIFTIIISSVFLFVIHPVYCDSLSTKDFGYGFILNISGDEPIYRLELPEAVYQGVMRQDLGDIRIFNGNGEIVPHLLRQSLSELEASDIIIESGKIAGQNTAKTANSNIQNRVPFFPLYSDRDSSQNNDISMNIIKNPDGTIISVRSSNNNPSNSAESEIIAYLLDMSKIKPYPKQLELEWSGGGDHFIINIALEGSSDLTHWDFMTEKTIAKLKFAGNSIYQNQIELEESTIKGNSIQKVSSEKRKQYKYFRLSWATEEKDSTSSAALISIRAIPPKPEPKIKRKWREINNGTFSQTNRMVVHFDSGGYFDVDAVQIKFNQTNSIIRATIESSSLYQSVSEHNTQWYQRCEGVFYTLNAGKLKKAEDAELSNSIFTFPITSDRFWRMKVSQDGAGLANSVYPPILKVGWIPHEILFVARGNPPYTLAYGSVKFLEQNANIIKMNSQSGYIIETILKDVSRKEIADATYGAPIILGGDDALQLPPPPIPWEKWILWGVLIFGVCLLAFMAWRLVNQMKINS